MRYNFEKFCKDYENIENYEKAKKDNFKRWECHHRLETHTSDGIRRVVDIPYKELIALGMYYNRPASELIFLTTREHRAYNKGKRHTEESKKKNAEAHKGNKNMLGKKHSEESKKKMRESHKGKKMSEESKNKNREAHKGMRFFNNGKINKRAKECPPGFVPGRLRKTIS